MMDYFVGNYRANYSNWNKIQILCMNIVNPRPHILFDSPPPPSLTPSSSFLLYFHFS